MKNSETTKQIGDLKNSGEIGDICKMLHWFDQEFNTMISHYSLVRSLKIFSIFVFQRNKTRQEKTIKRLLESFTHKTVNWYRKEILGGHGGGHGRNQHIVFYIQISLNDFYNFIMLGLVNITIHTHHINKNWSNRQHNIGIKSHISNVPMYHMIYVVFVELFLTEHPQCQRERYVHAENTALGNSDAGIKI